MRWLIVFLLFIARVCSAQSWTPVGVGTSVANLGGNRYALRTCGERLNYDSTGHGCWCVIEPTVCHFNPPVFGYNYGVCAGEYWALFPDSSDGAIAFVAKKGRHALTLKLAAAIYYSHNRDSVWTLATASKVAGVKDGSRINYPNTLPDIDWSFQYQNDRLKTGIVMKQAARNALPDPSVNGWTDNETWVAFAIEMKTYSFTGGEIIAMPTITWDTLSVSFSHSGILQFVLPKDIAYLNSDPSVQTILYRRLKTIGPKTYLLLSLRYTTLQSIPGGTVVFDPSPVIIGDTDVSDNYAKDFGPTINYGVSTGLYIGRASGNLTYHMITHFDFLSSVPSGATIDVAVCSSYCFSILGDSIPNIAVYRITADWIEGTADNAYEYGSSSWNNRGNAIAPTVGIGGTSWALTDSAWSTGGGDYNATPDDTVSILAVGWETWEVENLVQAQREANENFGMLFKEIDETRHTGRIGTRSSEHSTVETRPRLYVEYTEAPAGAGQGSWKNWGLTQWGQ